MTITTTAPLHVTFQHDDGGRAAAGFRGSTGDCATRAVAIAAALDYRTVYDRINELAKSERTGKRKRGKSNARTGVYAATMHRYLVRELGATWVPTMTIGSGCTVHVRADELPTHGRLVLRLSKHFAAYVDGVLHDTHDPSRDGTRAVYGYWILPQP